MTDIAPTTSVPLTAEHIDALRDRFIEAQEAALTSGKHFWVVAAFFTQSNPGADDLYLDSENLAMVTPIQCAICGEEDSGAPCPGI